MIKAIIFDCFGVLTKDWWREFLSTIPPGEIRERAKELNHQYDAGLISLHDFVTGVHQATGHQPQPIEEMFSVPKPLKNTELLDYIKKLKTNYKIGMLSNIGTNWVREHFLTQEEQQLFDTMIFSYEAGATKPDPRIYKLALQKLNVNPEETVFTDDIEEYCQAAKALGIEAIHYQDLPQLKIDLEQILSADSNNKVTA